MTRLEQHAHHEAGHAIAAVSVGFPLVSVSIDRDTHNGLCVYNWKPGNILPHCLSRRQQSQVEKSLIVLLSGRVAELLAREKPRLSYAERMRSRDDEKKIRERSEWLYFPETAQAYVAFLNRRTFDLLSDPLNMVARQKLVPILLERQRLHGAHATRLIRQFQNEP